MSNLSRPIPIPEPSTYSEKYLTSLCRKTFLSLWSYSNLYRDQGQRNGIGFGKEICDLLVLFDNTIIIFSDKQCAFPDSGNLDRDWSRWFRRAVLESANQIWGAERWIRTFPKRIYLDKSCSIPFPLNIPDSVNLSVHRVVVAHEVSARIQKEFGGSGTLIIDSTIRGSQHYLSSEQSPLHPFTIGNIDPHQGFIHVLDDSSLEIVLGTVDTIIDFISYLKKKETLLLGGMPISAAGEEELLAYYLSRVNEDREHDFLYPSGSEGLLISEGLFQQFQNSPGRKSQLHEDKISYYWDRLIETFAGHIAAGTDYFSSLTDIALKEESIREIARETRLRRRILARALLDLITKSSAHRRSVRVVPPSRNGEPYYLFLLMPIEKEWNLEKYRVLRRQLLFAYCMSVKIIYPDASKIIGIATESGLPDKVSNDVLLIDTTQWTEENFQEAQSIQKEYKLLENMKKQHNMDSEYPKSNSPSKAEPIIRRLQSLSRNKVCYCGSGKKYKECHGILVKKRPLRKRHKSKS